MKLLYKAYTPEQEEKQVRFIDLEQGVITVEGENFQDNQYLYKDVVLRMGFLVEEPSEAKEVTIYEGYVVKFTLEGLDAIGIWQVEEYNDYHIENIGALEWLAFQIDCGNAYDVEVIGDDWK